MNKSRTEHSRTVDKYKRHNVCVVECQKEKKGTEEIFEKIMTENFPQSMSDAKPQIQKAWRVPGRINTNKTKQIKPKPNLKILYSKSRKAEIKDRS